MDRVHRIGQTRPVRAIRFIMKDSIEERFVDVQDAKMALAKGSMERLKEEDRKKANVRISSPLAFQYSITRFSILTIISLSNSLFFSPTDHRPQGPF